MLRITNTGTSTEQKWILCGQLMGPWVAELKANWEQTRHKFPGRKYLVDLSDVTFIDEEGEYLLREMTKAGAEFLASGVDTRDVLENLRTKGRRPLRRFLAHLASGCGQSRGDEK
jgi:hypothetical protein